jgi:hypothetical protein
MTWHYQAIERYYNEEPLVAIYEVFLTNGKIYLWGETAEAAGGGSLKYLQKDLRRMLKDSKLYPIMTKDNLDEFVFSNKKAKKAMLDWMNYKD